MNDEATTPPGWGIYEIARSQDPYPAWDALRAAEPVHDAAGGVPVLEDGLLLGAVGISGASQEADEDIARAAMAALDG